MRPCTGTHTAINNRYHEPWQYGEVNTDYMRQVIDWRYQLLPYIYSSFYQAHTSGMPINRMLPIQYTHDTSVYKDEGLEPNSFSEITCWFVPLTAKRWLPRSICRREPGTG